MKLLLVACAMAGACGAADAFDGVVTRVSDGDTVWVRPDGAAGRPVKVRLLGLDAPERCQAWGAQATAALSARVLHRRVQVPTRAVDAYGRLLGGLQLSGGGGDEDIGAWMVAQGHAWDSRWHGRPGPYAAQELAARAARRGLFADPDAELPRSFRQRHGPCDLPH